MQNIDILQALKQLWKPENRRNALVGFSIVNLIQGSVLIVGAVGIFRLCPTDLYDSFDFKLQSIRYLLLNLLLFPIGALIHGYVWEYRSRLRDNGYEVIMPGWDIGNWDYYWEKGTKSLIFYLIFDIPLTLSSFFIMSINELSGSIYQYAILFFLFNPIRVAALIQAAETKSLLNLFNITESINALRQCYSRVILISLIICALPLLLLPGLLLVSCTIVGIPVLFTYFMLTAVHLETQAFDTYRPNKLSTD